jgi:hypothetical protein
MVLGSNLFYFGGISGGESLVMWLNLLTFGGAIVDSSAAWSWVRIFDFFGQWCCSAWSWVESLRVFWSMVVE